MWDMAALQVERVAGVAPVLAREGLGRTPAHELAAYLRASVGTMYRTYGSKMGVARCLLSEADSALAWQLQLTASRAGESGDFRHVLSTLWHDLVGAALQHPDVFAYAHLHWRHPRGAERRADGETGPGPLTREALEEVLERGMAEGALRPQPVLLAWMLLWGLLLQLVKAAHEGLKVTPERSEQAFNIVWTALAAGATTPPGGGEGSSSDTAHEALAHTSLEAGTSTHGARSSAEQPAAASSTSKHERCSAPRRTTPETQDWHPPAATQDSQWERCWPNPEPMSEVRWKHVASEPAVTWAWQRPSAPRIRRGANAPGWPRSERPISVHHAASEPLQPAQAERDAGLSPHEPAAGRSAERTEGAGDPARSATARRDRQAYSARGHAHSSALRSPTAHQSPGREPGGAAVARAPGDTCARAQATRGRSCARLRGITGRPPTACSPRRATVHARPRASLRGGPSGRRRPTTDCRQRCSPASSGPPTWRRRPGSHPWPAADNGAFRARASIRGGAVDLPSPRGSLQATARSVLEPAAAICGPQRAAARLRPSPSHRRSHPHAPR